MRHGGARASSTDELKRPDTLRSYVLAQLGHYLDARDGALVPPIQTSTNFARGADHEPIGQHIYSRASSPGDSLARSIFAALDGGQDALMFASGMAAITTLFETVDVGRHIVAPQVMYQAHLIGENAAPSGMCLSAKMTASI